MIDNILFVILGIFFFIMDIKTFDYTRCNQGKSTAYWVYFMLLVHHIANIYAQFGWLSSGKFLLYLYVITPLLVMLHWITNKNRCFLTEIVNNQCDLDPDTNFRDIWYFLGFKTYKYYDIAHYLFLAFAWVIACYRILS